VCERRTQSLHLYYSNTNVGSRETTATAAVGPLPVLYRIVPADLLLRPPPPPAIDAHGDGSSGAAATVFLLLMLNL